MHNQTVWRQLHQSRMDSLLPSRIASPTFGHFVGRHVRIGEWLTIGILDFEQWVAISFPDVHCHVQFVTILNEYSNNRGAN